MALRSTFGSDAPPLPAEGRPRLERLDAGLARDTYLDAWGAALLAGRSGARGSSLLDGSRAARSAPRPECALRPADLLLDSLATLTAEGRVAAAALLKEATRTFADEEFPAEASLRWGWLTVVPSYVLWDEESTYAICLSQMRAVRAAALARLSLDLATLGLLAVRCGDVAGAAGAITESDALAEATGTEMAPFSAMMLAALRAREAEARALIKSVRDEASPLGQGVAIQLTAWMFAILCNGLGRYEEALAAAQHASTHSPEELFVAAWAAMEALEAATRTGNPKVACVAREHIAAATALAGTDSALGILARSRALVSDGEAADELYREAIARLGRTRLRPELARGHVLYGEWLRRTNRRADAREQLRTADEMFLVIGMEAFADRARTELLASGEKVRKRTAETRDDLTAQERQIARLAGDGLSIPEIGARLFLSPRTVEWHLRNVFDKLDIRSRRELANVLAASWSQLAPA